MSEEKQQNGPNVLVCITDGSEDLEAVTIIDVLRRTQTLNVTVASIGGKLQITASRGTKMVGDFTIEQVSKQQTKFDMICLPGGMPGATNLGNDPTLKSLIAELNLPHLGMFTVFYIDRIYGNELASELLEFSNLIGVLTASHEQVRLWSP